jgi:hypothetical protein
MDDDLGITGGLKYAAGLFKARADVERVHDVAVVRERDHAFVAIHTYGLSIEQSGIAGGGIACVSDGERAGQAAERLFVEDVHDQTHGFMDEDGRTVGRGHASGFLSAMLECVHAEVGER